MISTYAWHMLDTATLPYIEIESSQYAGQRFHILESITIGRSKKNDVCLKLAQGLSRAHCMIDLTEDGYVIEDLDSRNGSYLNGIRVAHPIILKNDDVIQIGEVLIRYFQPLSFEETNAHIQMLTAEGGSLAKPSSTTAFSEPIHEDDDMDEDSELYEIPETDLRSVREQHPISIEDESLASGLDVNIIPEADEPEVTQRRPTLETEVILTEQILEDAPDRGPMQAAATERISRDAALQLAQRKRRPWLLLLLFGILLLTVASPFLLDMFGFKQPLNWLTQKLDRTSEKMELVIEQSKKRLHDPEKIAIEETPEPVRPTLPKPVLSEVSKASTEQAPSQNEKEQQDVDTEIATKEAEPASAAKEEKVADIVVVKAAQSGALTWKKKNGQLVNRGDVIALITGGYSGTIQRKINTLNDEISALKEAARNGSLRAAKDLVKAKQELASVKRGRSVSTVKAQVSGQIVERKKDHGAVKRGQTIAQIKPI